ncbi:flagellar biosynthesis anti-sigma factor FlgM [Vulcaniibacterium tengchongense]|uniref:Negative regulator of flagellin synthesis n=1 Tax=Vulcaniibacterium tengchongense TaxID=1273429 RepID=A0A3N4VE24_9GAMM|nr:flagellar biosynthesis anti-sigma factor FlgM [Vulcaniibacterium tengchongense]RPE80888.1 FlgM family anti-sigma-28 factor [Vulcaniibacterium tengchongense]
MTHKIDGALPPLARPADAAAGTAARARAGAEREQPVAAASAAGDQMRLTGDAAGLQALERELGAAPAGIDVAKVNGIRAALADGSYRVDPQAIAERMLALETDLAR